MLYILKDILINAISFSQNSDSIDLTENDLAISGFSSLSGYISASDELKFSRTVFRISKGNAIVKFKQITR